MKDFDKFYAFAVGYAEFFEKVREKEEEKFKALHSREPKRMDIALNENLAIQDEIAEYEKKRVSIHEELGISGLPLKDVIASLKPETGADADEQKLIADQKEKLTEVYERLKIAVEAAKHLNQRSMEYCQMNIDIINEINGNFTNAPTYNANGQQSNNITRPSLINKKA